MCRLFGLSAAPRRVHATFWLMDAPDSLAEQSRRMPDGTGLGTFSEAGEPKVEKQPLAAYEDEQFAAEAKTRESSTFVAHVRFATTGDKQAKNTHPFLQKGRMFAHNGVIEDLVALDAQLGAYRDLVVGDTDSERFFALITRHIDENAGDVTAGVVSATQWIAANLPLLSLNFVLTSSNELWALRYPSTHHLLFLERQAGGTTGKRQLHHASGPSTIRVRSAHLANHCSVIVASEQMDEDPGWTPLQSGELLHVSGDLEVSRRMILDRPPARQLPSDEIDEVSAPAQAQSHA